MVRKSNKNAKHGVNLILAFIEPEILEIFSKFFAKTMFQQRGVRVRIIYLYQINCLIFKLSDLFCSTYVPLQLCRSPKYGYDSKILTSELWKKFGGEVLL